MRNKTDRMVTDSRRPPMTDPADRIPVGVGTQAAHDLGCWCEGRDCDMCTDCPLRRMTGNPHDDRARARTKA